MMSSSNDIKSLNLIIKKSRTKSGYRVFTSSSAIAAIRNKESSVSPNLSPSASSNSLCSANMTEITEESSNVDAFQPSLSETEQETAAVAEKMPESSSFPSSSTTENIDTSSQVEVPSKNDTVDDNNNTVVAEKVEDDDKLKLVACDFCHKMGNVNSFCGRFCNKTCVIRFAQKRGVMMKTQKKGDSTNEPNENKLLIKLRKNPKRHKDEEDDEGSHKKMKTNDENDKNSDLVLRTKANRVNSIDNDDSCFNSIKNESDISDYNNEGKLLPSVNSNSKNQKEHEINESFDWESYLKATDSIAAPENCFKNSLSKHKNNFQVGMLLEGVDNKHSSLICVLSVSEVQGYRIRLHFEGYECRYDFWRNADSREIYPVGYCKKHKLNLMPPLGYTVENFDWSFYLKKTQRKAATESCFVKSHNFQTESTAAFKAGMKIEAVDKHNPMFVRVATVTSVYKSQIKIHYDGFSYLHDVLFDKNSEDIHPIRWCERNGQKLTAPSIFEKITPCPNKQCTGLGHIKGYRFETHYSDSGCPYSLKNLNKENVPDRLGDQKILESNIPPKKTANKVLPLKEINSKLSISGRSNNKRNIILPKRDRKKLKSPCLKAKHVVKTKNKVITPKTKKQNENRLSKSDTRILLKNVRTTMEEDIHETVFMSSSKPMYNFPFFVKYNKNLVKEHEKYTPKEIKKWKSKDVYKFINTIPGCEKSSGVFMDQQIDGQAFLLLKEDDLIKRLNIQLGPAIKIFNIILAFRLLQSN